MKRSAFPILFIVILCSGCLYDPGESVGDQPTKAAPATFWSDDEANDKIVVAQVPMSIPWKEFHIKREATGTATVRVAINAAPVSGMAFGTDYREIPSNAPVAAGDALQFCAASPAGESSVTILLLHAPSNSQSHRFTFATIGTNGC